MLQDRITDFGDKEKCRNYLSTKFDDLLDGVTNSYGKELMEELMNRLEKTVETFHKDMKGLIGELRHPVMIAVQAAKDSAAPASRQTFPAAKGKQNWEQYLQE